MATYTPNYNLSKPENTDSQQSFISDYCDNMDKLDNAVGESVTDVEVNGVSVVVDGVAQVTVPTKTSDLNNDSDFVSDASYVHTDNNFSNADVTKLSGIEAGAEVNVQADWNEADNTADDYIKNKPSNLVQDASYVHTDNNFTNAEKTKLSGIESGAEVNVQSDWSQTDNTKDDFIKNKPTAENKSATTEFNTVNGGLLQKCIINLEPVQSGSGDPSPDNVRPISGHTEVDLYNVGKNFLPMTLANIKSINTTGTWSGNTYTLNGGTFTIVLNGDKVLGINVNGTFSGTSNFRLYDNLAQFKGMTLNGCPSGGGDSTYRMMGMQTVSPYAIYAVDEGSGSTISNNTTDPSYLIIRVYAGSYTNKLFKPMIRKSTDSADFEPYKGNLYQVQIGSTVYGGYVDLVSGVLTVTHICETVTGGFTLYGNYGDDNKPLYRIILTDYMKPHATVDDDAFFTTNRFTPISVDRVQGMLSGEIRTSNATPTRTIYVRWDDIADVNALNTYLSTNSLQICGELATPITIKLTPQQISALIGENNLSTPLSGQTIDEVEYREVFGFDDVEKVVSLRVPLSMLGTDESGRTTASQSYASGDYFYKDGYMCKALTSISAGATLTLNTNYSQGTLADILKAIENA